MQTIHLQYIGLVPALPIEEVKPGALLSWNSAYKQYECVSVEKASACFYNLTERCLKTGKEWTRRVKAGRLIAAQNPTA